ncbi:hypothetical protein OAO18_07995, partial [Francisellaceae bacterium]|nr:hypothetical protein [Francisellaceae bacterium]
MLQLAEIINGHPVLPNVILQDPISGSRNGATYTINNSFSDSAFNVNMSVNHQGIFRMYITYDGSDPSADVTISDESKLAVNDIQLMLYTGDVVSKQAYNSYPASKYDQNSKITAPNLGYKFLDKGIRLLYWSNYFHDCEILYVKPTGNDSNPSEYFYAHKDTITSAWKFRPIKIQASQDDFTSFCTASSLVDAHHIELYAVNSNEQIVTLADSDFLEVRFDVGCNIIDNSDPKNPVNINATRLNSYFIKPVNGRIYLNVFLDQAGNHQGATIYYRLISADQFNVASLNSPVLEYINGSTSPLVDWAQFNISYNAHARLAEPNNYTTPTYGDTGSGAADEVSQQTGGYGSVDSYVSKNFSSVSQVNISTPDDVKTQWLNGHQQIAKAGAPDNSSSLSFSTINNDTSLNPLYASLGVTSSSSASMVNGFWSDIWDDISDIASAIWNGLEDAYNSIISNIDTIADDLNSIVNDIATLNFSQLFQDIKSIASAVYALVNIVQDIGDFVFNEILSLVLKWLLQYLNDPGKDILENLKQHMDWDDKTKALGYISDNIDNAAKSVLGNISNPQSSIDNAINKNVINQSAMTNQMHKRIASRLGLKGAADIDSTPGLVFYYENSTKSNYLANEIGKNSQSDSSFQNIVKDVDPTTMPIYSDAKGLNDDNQANFSNSSFGGIGNMSFSSFLQSGTDKIDFSAITGSGINPQNYGSDLLGWIKQNIDPSSVLPALYSQNFTMPSSMSSFFPGSGVISNQTLSIGCEDIASVIITLIINVNRFNPVLITPGIGIMDKLNVSFEDAISEMKKMVSFGSSNTLTSSNDVPKAWMVASVILDIVQAVLLPINALSGGALTWIPGLISSLISINHLAWNIACGLPEMIICGAIIITVMTIVSTIFFACGWYDPAYVVLALCSIISLTLTCISMYLDGASSISISFAISSAFTAIAAILSVVANNAKDNPYVILGTTVGCFALLFAVGVSEGSLLSS